MQSKPKQNEDDNKIDETDGIIPPIIINTHSSPENEVVIFKNKKGNEEEPELILSTDTLPSDPPPYSSIDTSQDELQTSATGKGKNTLCQRIRSFLLLVLKNITLEPAEFMFGLSGTIAMASFSQMLIDKSCNDKGFNSTICDNILDYDDIYDEINHDVIYHIFHYF